MKLAETAIRLQEKHVLEIEMRNEMLLFSSRPGGTDSENSKCYFALKQVLVLRNMKRSTTYTATDPTTTLNVLGNAATTIED